MAGTLPCCLPASFDPTLRLEEPRWMGIFQAYRAGADTVSFPACRAVVHDGGAGTTAVSLRAGVPTLILSTWGDQTVWGARVKRLKVGTARGFSVTTRELLVADLRTILAPEYVARARELATRMSKPAESETAAADLMENVARTRRVG